RSDEEESVSNLFLRSELTDGGWGTARFLTRIGGPKNAKNERFADAVAVSGVLTLAAPQRRAVVLVVGGERDFSRHSARDVRRYLERIGVPLYVWSLAGLREDVIEAWAPVVSIANATALRDATKALRDDLDRQRIAWLPVGPLEALRVETTPDCAYTPLVR
ncbi:MAG TPA: hypothetical protein VHL59_05275, partial [Thermoanaerobaculia bacterium]|nr:hypothetical protein [Thermoanaerobaculia bacterium]